MPFEISEASDVLTVRTRIRALAQEPDVIRRLSAFSRWKIAPARAGTGYRLINCAGEGRIGASDGYYVTNLVLQGGGTLGLAHVGLIVGLEDAGFRFPVVAGTSAGAIVTMGQFALRGNSLLNPVGERLAALVEDMPMDTFVDGPRAIRRVVKRFAAGRAVLQPVFLPGLFFALRRILRFRGLNSGMTFERWISRVLSEAGVDTIEALQDLMERLAVDLSNIEEIEDANGKVLEGEKCRALNPFRRSGAPVDADAVLKLIATAMPTGMKFCLPQHLKLLHHEYQDITPGLMVRMSMSIPLFFEPCVLRTNEVEWSNHVWSKIAPFVSDRTAGDMADLRELIFLDGGLFSNLPTDEAVRDMSDDIACLSVPLVHDTPNVGIQNKTNLSALVSDAVAVANAVRLQRDRDAHHNILQDAPGNRRILKIDTGTAHWLNFNMSKAEKELLYLAGLKRVQQFLETGELTNDQ